jgi:hypothetical protein
VLLGLEIDCTLEIDLHSEIEESERENICISMEEVGIEWLIKSFTRLKEMEKN